MAEIQVAQSSSDSSLLWKLSKSFRSSGYPSNLINTEVAAQYFESVHFDPSEPCSYSACEILDGVDGVNLSNVDPFTVDELKFALTSLKTGKAPGPSGVSNEILKLIFKGPKSIALLLLFLNRCLESGVVPSQWLFAHEIILFKGKGSVSDVTSYRGITLLEVMSKLYEQLIYNLYTIEFILGQK